MSLTPAQAAVLKADILLDPVLGPLPNTADNAFTIAAAYNLSAIPDFFVWKVAVSVNELMSNGFDWTRVDNLTVSKARIWEWMTQLGVINPSLANVRAGVNTCFSVGADSATRLAIFTASQEKESQAALVSPTVPGDPAQSPAASYSATAHHPQSAPLLSRATP